MMASDDGLVRLVTATGRSTPSLSKRQMAALVAYARTGDTRLASAQLGVPHSTLKSQLADAYERLDVYGAINAFRALGWLTVQS